MKRLKAALFRYGTPLTVGLFLVSTVSGVALFFHLGTNLFREMHEILSLVLLVPVILHLWRNWPGFKNYFRRAAMPISLGLSLIAAGAYAYGGWSKPNGGNPAIALMGAAQKAPLHQLAPILGLDESGAVTRLQQAGFTAARGTETIAGIAAQHKVSPMTVMAKLTAPTP
ncbi:hypothetical protein GCM10011497_20130 [Elstera cyanobacteriorum]|uniref:DUF4405 domain-containing protein n=1 Tax=Elstera cyanobacteriorum TaxID=2022747 RepID=UPI0014830214|nr:DUF4405 domain-containing protein [Elstera cyanobacteriorum]GFZ90500.1 hypothetical protein GCM10011497_20130 [Elstera cyanobacteriorum]